jgi:hypothetical protein
LADILSLNRVLPNVRFQLGSTADPALLSYNPSTDFATRESKVQAWAVKGEVLEATLSLLPWIEAPGRVNLFKQAPGDSTWKGIDVSWVLSKHSIDLHAAALVTPNFETQADTLTGLLPILFNASFYGYPVTGTSQNALEKLLRNEVGVPGAPAQGMLTHFSEDLQKLGTNIAGLNKAAQDAIISQGIEWYYWQGTGYAGQNFFFNNGQAGLLQYTSAVGAALTNALNKASAYTQQ